MRHSNERGSRGAPDQRAGSSHLVLSGSEAASGKVPLTAPFVVGKEQRARSLFG